jgi:diguanylate cyclase (GGDEF)-like protein/PAS domain S-box-containing protein
MPDLILDPPSVEPCDKSSLNLMHDALLESRRRWRHLVTLAADLAFETDAAGRLVFVLPETALGWPAGMLIGQPADLLLTDDGANGGFNPFQPSQDTRHRRCWLRRHDGTLAMMAVSAGPVRGSHGEIQGARVIGIDVTDLDTPATAVTNRLRHGDVLDHVLARVGQETEADRMMDVALWSMMHALEAEGAAVLASLADETGIELVHECGPGGLAITELAAAQLLEASVSTPKSGANADGRLVLTIACPSKFSSAAGVAVWRAAGARRWSDEESRLAASATGVVRMILDYEAMLQRMAEQARTDPLTGLCNRRAFLEEMGRHLVRLDRDPAPGTLMFLDLDSFKSVNDQYGHAAGDRVLVTLADLLRRLVRPSDVIARLGGDEFAVWMSGADHMTAAERADHLCKSAPDAFNMLLPEPLKGLGLSVGIATRTAGSKETIQDLTRRADLAMYEVKRGGRGHWRVALLDGIP